MPVVGWEFVEKNGFGSSRGDKQNVLEHQRCTGLRKRCTGLTRLTSVYCGCDPVWTAGSLFYLGKRMDFALPAAGQSACGCFLQNVCDSSRLLGQTHAAGSRGTIRPPPQGVSTGKRALPTSPSRTHLDLESLPLHRILG